MTPWQTYRQTIAICRGFFTPKNIRKSNVEQNDEEMVVDVEEVNSKKFNMIDSSNKLQTENSVLKKELERMKRVFN